MKYSVIGTRPVRHDGVDKVTGRALYGADFRVNDLLHGYVLRSQHAHARITHIDSTRAYAVPGVKAIVTADDFPQGPDRTVDLGEGEVSLSNVRANMLASTKVLYHGQAVAAVAATSQHVAEAAAQLIEVRYEVLPVVLNVLDAMSDDAPVLHDDLTTTGLRGRTARNVAEYICHELGNIADGFRDAAVIIEREFETSTVHQGYIEPHVATVYWNHDGRVMIWSSTQGSFTVREVTACVLEIPVSRVRVTPMEIGGGFGGKIPVYLEPVAALLSKKAGHPVRIVMSRKDVFEGTGPAAGSFIKVRIGADMNGRITSAQAYLAYEAGAYQGSMVGWGMKCIFAAYNIPNLLIEGFDVLVNKPSTAAYRAPGATTAAFATETVVDEIAEKLQMDPLDFRLRNAAREGTLRADGEEYARVGCVQVLQAMKEHPHYNAPLVKPCSGRGVAIGFWLNAGLSSTCTLTLNADGTVNLIEGSVDIGGTRTSIAMQVAEVLGISVKSVIPTIVDTDSIGFTSVTGGSRTTVATGWAAVEAAHDLLSKMKRCAAKLWQAEIVEFDKGIFWTLKQSMTFAELASLLNKTGEPLVGHGAVNPQRVGGSFSGCIADVEVDIETGKTTVSRFTAIQDAGIAIHPSYVEGQMQGGSVQGIGWALNEEYVMTPAGKMLNSSLLDYRMPTALDVPMIDVKIVEVPSPDHPFGARGVGETSIVPPPAAIANAIYRATKVRMNRLPMNPPNVLNAILKLNETAG